MLNQTAAMALAVRRLADAGTRPVGDVLFWAAPDEECGGHQGVRPILERWPHLVNVSAAVTEVGGCVLQAAQGPAREGYAAEKGAGALVITVRGDTGHSSLPFGRRNAIGVAAEVVLRLQAWNSTIRVSEPWRRWVEGRYDGELRTALLDPQRVDEGLALLPADEAAHAHACTRCTLTPTMIQGGDKINSLPSTVRIGVNVRPTWGDDLDHVVAELRALLADLIAGEDVAVPALTSATTSSVAHPLWQVLREVTHRLADGAALLAAPLAAQTDARWLRPAGIPTFGFGLLSPRVDRTSYWSRFHGVDERIDTDSLELSVLAYEQVVRTYCC